MQQRRKRLILRLCQDLPIKLNLRLLWRVYSWTIFTFSFCPSFWCFINGWGNKHGLCEHVQRTWVVFLEPMVYPRLGYSLADCSHAALASPRLFSRIIFSELTKPIKLNKLFKWRTVLRAYGFRCICTFSAYIQSWVSWV